MIVITPENVALLYGIGASILGACLGVLVGLIWGLKAADKISKRGKE